MRIFWIALAVLLWSFPAAAQVSYVIKDGNGNIQTIKSVNCSSQICPLMVPSDASGTPLTGAAGSPAGSALTVQGIADGQAIPTTIGGTLPAFAATPTFNIGGTLPAFASTPTFNLGGTLPAFASTPTFNCGTGCSSTGGTFNNNADGVATSSTNGQNAAWPYLWNGTGWDRWYGDRTNGAWVNIKTGSVGLTGTLPAFASTPTVNLGTIGSAALETGGNLASLVTDFGAPGATACSSDTASCNQNQQLQRLAQRLTSLVTALGSPFQAGGSIGNTTFGSTVTAWGGSTLSAATSYGTAPGGGTGTGLYPVFNAYVLNTIGGVGNNSDSISATASPNAGSPVVNYAYGYSATTSDWDRLQEDLGKTIDIPYAARSAQLVCSISITTTTAAPCTGMGAQGAGIKVYITDLACSRNDAGATALTVTTNAQDSTSTNYVSFDVPDNGGGGGNNRHYSVPIHVAANTGLTLTASAGVTTLHCDAEGYSGS